MATFKKIVFSATTILIILALKFYYDDRDGFTEINTYIFDEIDIENFVSFNDMIKLNIISSDSDRFYTGDTAEVKQAINDIQKLKIKKVKNFIESEKYYFVKFTGTTKTHTITYVFYDNNYVRKEISTMLMSEYEYYKTEDTLFWDVFYPKLGLE